MVGSPNAGLVLLGATCLKKGGGEPLGKKLKTPGDALSAVEVDVGKVSGAQGGRGKLRGRKDSNLEGENRSRKVLFPCELSWAKKGKGRTWKSA